VYQRVASGPEALTGLGIRHLELAVFILIVSLAVPTVLLLFEMLVSRVGGEWSWRIFHGLALGAMVALILWQNFANGGPLWMVLPLLLTGGFAYVYTQSEFVRSFCLILTVAAPVVIVFFLFSYPINAIGLPGAGGTPGQDTDSEIPVVVVVLDELPLAALLDEDQKIDKRFYPQLSALTETSTWYRNALSVADNTLAALPAILTGQNPDDSGAFGDPPPPGLSNYPDSVCAIAEGAGYETYGDELVTDLCGRSDGFGTRLSGLLRQGIPSYPGANGFPSTDEPLTPGSLLERAVYRITGLVEQPRDAYSLDRPETVESFIRGMPARKRSLSLLHVALPHVEYQFTPKGHIYASRNLFDAGTDQAFSEPDNEAESGKNLQQLTSQMMFTDAAIGRLVKRMKDEGIWEESLFVLTADHGAAFVNGQSRRFLTEENAGWILPVPLFIKYPGQESGEINDSAVDSRDITPTILSELGLKPGADSVGEDLTVNQPGEDRPAAGVSSSEGRLELSRDRVEQQLERATVFRNRLFGSGSLYAIGRRPGLLGKQASKVKGLEPIDSISTSPIPADDVDLESLTRPVYFEATLPELSGDPGLLAVAINGRIEATTRAWERGGNWITAVNLPDDAFRQGENIITVYASRD